MTFCFLTNVLNSISERFGSISEEINISRKVTAITVACILIYYLDKDLQMACNRQSSLWARILLLLTLTHSLTQLDSIVANASIGSKLQKLVKVSKKLFLPCNRDRLVWSFLLHIHCFSYNQTFLSIMEII